MRHAAVRFVSECEQRALSGGFLHMLFPQQSFPLGSASGRNIVATQEFTPPGLIVKNLYYSKAERVVVPRMAALEQSRRELSENISFEL